MTVTYCTADDVRNFLRLPQAFSTSTTPSLSSVNDRINEAEDSMDNETGHAWRIRYSGTKTGEDTTARIEYYDVDFFYEFQTGRPIYLDHRFIRTLDANLGDSLEFWNGSSWDDFLANRVEARESDFWLDYDSGMLFVKQRFGIVKPRGMRIKYRYGESTVPDNVKKIAILLTCIDLISTEGKAVLLPETSSGMTYQQKVDLWKKQAETKLNRLKEFKIPRLWL